MKQEGLAQQRFREACDVSTRYAESSAPYFKTGSSRQSCLFGWFARPAFAMIILVES